jgi:hypothetical protein
VTRLAWVLCLLAVVLAAASVPLAAFNGEDLGELVTNHHAIGILTALVLAPVGALIVVGDRRHLLAWLLLGNSLTLAAYTFSEQYAPLALGLTPARLSLPGGELASWLASWAFVPGIVIGVVFLPLLFPDGRLPSRRWWPLGLAGALAMAVPTVVLAVGTWPLRGPGLVPQDGEDPELVTAVFGITLLTALTLGAVSVAALILRFRHAGAVQRQQIKWFAYCAAPSVPLGMFAQVQPYGPYLEFLGAALQLAGLGGGRGHPGRGHAVPAGPPPRPAGRRPALQPPQVRRDPDHRAVQRPPPRPGGPGHPVGRAAGGGRPRHAADGDVAVAASLGRRPGPGVAAGADLSGPGLRAGRSAGSLRGRRGRRHAG